MSGPAIGDVVAGRYEIRDVERHAPAYRCFRAFDSEVEVDVALWVPHSDLFGDEVRRDAFIGAAVDMRSFTHQHLLKVFDAGRDGDQLYLTAQRGTDDNLLPRPGRKALGETDLLHYAASVAAAFDAAHQAGLIHGRLVPDDIVHIAGLIKVGGIGLWSDIDPVSARHHWQKRERYLAPEVRRGGAPTPAADVYSVARLLAELAAGSVSDKIEKVLARKDAELASALEPALSVAPDRRPPTVGKLLQRVRQALLDDQLPTVENPPGAEVRLPGADLRLPTGGFDSGTPIDGGGYAEQDDPTRDYLHLHRAPRVATNDMPDSELVDPPRADASTAPFRRPVGKSFDVVEEATVAEDMVPPHKPPPPVVRPPTAPPAAAPPAAAPPAPRATAKPAAARPGAPLARPIDAGPPGGAPPPMSPPPERQMPLVAAPSNPGMAPAKIEAVSMKPASSPGTKRKPAVAAIDRGVKPKLRSLGELAAGAQRPLGNYAPPKNATSAKPKRSSSRTWLYVALTVLVLGAAAIAVIVLLRRGAGESADQEPKPQKQPAPVVVAPVISGTTDAAAQGPCPSTMVLIEKLKICIDRHEAPGKSRQPATGMSLAAAERRCAARKARLCTGEEWEAGCRGENGASWPYGSAFRGSKCNIGRRGSVSLAGSHPECVSAVGAFDMSGNVAEWTKEGHTRGGSALSGGQGRCSTRKRRAQNRGHSDVGYRCCAAAR